MSKLSERILQRRTELGLSQEELASRMGYRSKSSITKLEKGVNDLPQAKLEALARALDTTPAYLLGAESVPVPAGFEPLPRMVRLPLVDSAACVPDAERAVKGYVGVPAAWGADFALECRGDDMSPTLNDGDIVCIRRQTELGQGDIAAVRVGGELLLRFYHRQGGSVILLAGGSAAARPLIFPADASGELRLEGRAVGLCRGL